MLWNGITVIYCDEQFAYMSSFFQTPHISEIIVSTFMSPLLVHTSYTHLYYMCPILFISLDFGLITILKGTLLRFYSCNCLGASNQKNIITFRTNHWAPIIFFYKGWCLSPCQPLQNHPLLVVMCFSCGNSRNLGSMDPTDPTDPMRIWLVAVRRGFGWCDFPSK